MAAVAGEADNGRRRRGGTRQLMLMTDKRVNGAVSLEPGQNRLPEAMISADRRQSSSGGAQKNCRGETPGYGL